jgi:hypothetical protein
MWAEVAAMSAPFSTRSDEAEAEVAELAAELLEITSEEELEEFLGKLASSVVRGAKNFMKSGVGKAVGGALKSIAKTALPAVGGALGSFLLPGVGTAIGARLGSMAGGLLEVGEAEALGEAEAEFEAAQRYVRFARAAYANASRAPRNTPPRSVARAATVTAARRYAPGLLRDRADDRRRNRGRSTGSGDRRPSGGGRPQGGRGRRPDRGRGPGWYPGPVYPTYPWGGPWVVAGNDGYTWPGYAGPGWVPPGPPEPAPGDPEPGDGQGTPDADQETAGPVGTGQWVRRGHRIVVLGV